MRNVAGGADRDGRDRGVRDSGVLLVLVLVLVLVLGMVVVSLARYSSAGLRSTRVSDDRAKRTSAADAGLRLGVELIKLAPLQCTSNMTVPNVNKLAIRLDCAANGAATASYVPLILTATSSNSGTSIAIATVQVASTNFIPCIAACAVTVNSWSISS